MLTIICLQRTAALIYCYSFTEDFSPCLPVSFANDSYPFLCFSLQRIVVLVFCYSSAKKLRSLITPVHSQKTAVLSFLLYVHKGLRPCLPVSFAKDCCPYFPFCLRRTAVLVLCLFIYKGLLSLSCAIHLQRTAALVLSYSFAKDHCPCLVLFICKGRCPCPVLFIFKAMRSLISAIVHEGGLWSLISAIHSQRLWSLFSAIHLQMTMVLDFRYLYRKDCALAYWFQLQRIAVLDSVFLSTVMHLQRTVSLVHLKFVKDCCPCFLVLHAKDYCLCFFCFSCTKDCRPCFLLFVCN